MAWCESYGIQVNKTSYLIVKLQFRTLDFIYVHSILSPKTHPELKPELYTFTLLALLLT